MYICTSRGLSNPPENIFPPSKSFSAIDLQENNKQSSHVTLITPSLTIIILLIVRMNEHDGPPPPALLGVLPESLAAWKNGWTEIDETKAFTLIDKAEFLTTKWATLSRTRLITWQSLLMKLCH
jgi:hypothetical protein